MEDNVDSHRYHGNVHCGDAHYAIKGNQHYGGTALKNIIHLVGDCAAEGGGLPKST